MGVYAKAVRNIPVVISPSVRTQISTHEATEGEIEGEGV